MPKTVSFMAGWKLQNKCVSLWPKGFTKSRALSTTVCLFFLCMEVWGAKTKEELNAAIEELSAVVNSELAQDSKVIETINVLVAKPLTIVVGNIAAKPGQTINLPIFFKASTQAVSSIQFDFKFPQGVSVSSVQAGPSAISAGKSVQTSATRALIFGINQTAIESGVLLNFKLSVSSTLTNGIKPVDIFNLVGASPEGNSVSLFGISGSINVN